MDIGEKIQLIRAAEGLTQAEFASETGINRKTLENYEQQVVKNYSTTVIQKITNHERFSKYTLWLMNDIVMPEAGQISPEVEEARLGLRA